MNDNKHVDVLLLAPHRHLGVPYIKGDVINVTAEQKDWLVAHNVAMPKLITAVGLSGQAKGLDSVETDTKQDKKS